MANKLIIEVNAAKPEKPKKRWPRGWLLAAAAVSVLLAAAGGYVLYRAGRPVAVPAQVNPGAESAPSGTVAVAVAETVPTNPPMAAVAPLKPSEAITPAVLPEPPRPGAVRVTVSAPEYAADFLAGTGKRLRLDTNGWDTVPSFPYVVAPVSAGSRLIRVEADGFDCTSLQGTNGATVLVEGGVTNEAAFTLAPRPATLTIACDVTNATVRIVDRESGVGNPVMVPSLKPLTLAVSAPGHRAQNLNLDSLVPGAAERREIRLERESGTVRVTATVPTNAAAFLAGTAKRVRIGSGGWVTVEALPHELTNLVCGVTELTLEAEGFGTATQRVTVADGQTVTAGFTLTPRPATLTVACNVTNAVVRIGDLKMDVGNPVTVPSLAPLEVQVSAAGYVAQTVKLTGIKPGGTFRQEVTLEPEPKAAAADSGAGRKAGETQTVDLGGGVKMELVWCPPGSFTMGSPESETGRKKDETQHRVTLTKGFWLGKTEVTQAQWEAVMGNNSSHFKGADLPVEMVSWDECQEFVWKLNARVTGGGFRLPTEAEWEYAARGGTKNRGYTYAGGNDLDAVAWYNGNSGKTTHAVGTKASNELGLFDMSGNVWEWCRDGYGDYPSGSVTDPAGAASGSFRVGRGGSWIDFAFRCRSANRDIIIPYYRFSFIGFRAARTLP